MQLAIVVYFRLILFLTLILLHSDFLCFPEQTEVFMKPGKIQTRPKNGLDIFLTKQPRMNPNPLLEAYTPPGKLRNFFSVESIGVWCLV